MSLAPIHFADRHSPCFARAFGVLPVPILYAVTLFASALLLFLVQPMVGRMILPLLGGSTVAWNTCMVFFQAVLLLGYLYAHKLTAKLSPTQQVRLHLSVLAFAIGVMALAVFFGPNGSPIAVVKSLAPQSTSYPMFGTLALLFVAIAVPFFAVSTSAPLLQRWFAYTGHPSAKDPYFLYAASNAGSLLSLLAYPFAIEPSLRLVNQAWLFGLGFVVLFVMVFICSRTIRTTEVSHAARKTTNAEPEPTLFRKLKWLALAFVPSSLMLGVTTHMTTDIASVPLLWVFPLALYLVTFIIAFAKTPSWYRLVLGNISPVVTLLLVFVLIAQTVSLSTFYSLALHLLAYFLTTLLCHSELARDRPSAQYLTSFYLWLSLGGMVGGIFNALFAPLVFSLAWEYPIAIAIGCMLIPKLDENVDDKREGERRLLDLLFPAIMLVAVALLTYAKKSENYVAMATWLAEKLSGGLQYAGIRVQMDDDRMIDLIQYALPAMACFFFIDRPLRFGLCVAALLFVGYYRQDGSNTLAIERSGYGIVKVTSYRSTQFMQNRLVHGTTLHGTQSTLPPGVPLLLDDYRSRYWRGYGEPVAESQFIGTLDGWSALAKIGLWGSYSYSDEPLTYYHRSGPVGHIYDVATRTFPKPNFAMVGLGTGSASCYAGPGQTLTFYEIDPTVKALVADQDKYFSYVTQARKRGATVDIILGDARLKLEENTAAKYDLMFVDAFSSDSIPVHLLTKESVSLYLDRVKDNGLVALHISNKYVYLEPVVAKICEELGLHVMMFGDSWQDDEQDHPAGKTQSTWTVLARDPKLLEPFKEPKYSTKYNYTFLNRDQKPNVWEVLKPEGEVNAWTDDYADVLSVMRIKEIQQVRKFLGLPTLDWMLR
jgi:hypothetical protein